MAIKIEKTERREIPTEQEELIDGKRAECNDRKQTGAEAESG
jgi:hypothetical protein